MNKYVKTIVATVILTVLGTMVCGAQPHRDSTARFRVYFHVDQSDLDLSHMGNYLTLKEMDNVLDSLLKEHVSVKVSVDAGASPEGTEGGNLKLAEDRTSRLRLYLLTHHPRLDEKDLSLSSRAADWDGAPVGCRRVPLG